MTSILLFCLIFIGLTFLAAKIVYKSGKDVRSLEILDGMESIVDCQGNWKDVKGDPYQDGYFQGREDALMEVLDLFEKREGELK